MNISISKISTHSWLARTACAIACLLGQLGGAVANETNAEHVLASTASVAAEAPAWVQQMQASLDEQHSTTQALKTANEKLLGRLDIQEQRLLDAQRKSVDWWLTAIGVALAVFGLMVAVVGMWLPWKERQRLQNAAKEFAEMQRVARDEQSELRRIRQEAEQALHKLQSHEKEGAQNAAEIKKARMQAAQFQSGKNSPQAGKVDAAVHKLKAASADPIDQLRVHAIKASQITDPTKEQAQDAYELWKALTVLDASDLNAQFNAGYWAQEIYELAKEPSRKQWLVTLAQHYSAVPNSDMAAYNWGNALAAEAAAVAQEDLENARALWQQAGEKYAQALRIKADKHEAAFNWGNALDDEATAVAPTDPETARALWQQASEKYAQALRIKADDHDIANNWVIAYINECHALHAVQQFSESEYLLQKAQTLLEQRIAQHPYAAPRLAYNLACVYGMQNQVQKAIEQLELARANNELPAHWRDDPDFDAIRQSAEYLAWVEHHFSSTPQ